MSLNNTALYDYLRLTPDEQQKQLEVTNPEIVRILQFRSFQIERAAALMGDVGEGHTGN